MAIYSNPEDPYWPLAEEIAGAEDAPLLDAWDDVDAVAPVAVLWVADPAEVTEQRLIEVAQRGDPWMLGIITGSTMAQARALWQRAVRVRMETLLAVDGNHPADAAMAGTLVAYGSRGTSRRALTKEALLRALTTADYVAYAGGGAGNAWMPRDDLSITPADLPALPPSIVDSGGCQTFRIWRGRSIALAFVDHGAAAYAGFMYSPAPYYLMGLAGDFAFRYAWAGFPAGRILQVQNRGVTRGFARFPWRYLLGDPRLSLSGEPPYHVDADVVAGDTRTLRLSGAPEGIVPVRIADGAAYAFVEVAGVTASWPGDTFYDSRLQFVDVGADRFALIEHHGGPLTLHLRTSPPWYWPAANAIEDSLDHTLLFLAAESRYAMLVLALFIAVVAWRVAVRRLAARALLPALATGMAMAALHGAYAWSRVGNVDTVSRVVHLHPVVFAGTFLFVASAAAVYLAGRKPLTRLLAVAISTAPAWLAAGFWFASITLVDIVSSYQIGTPIYSYTPALVPLLATIAEGVFMSLVFWGMRRVTVVSWGGGRTVKA